MHEVELSCIMSYPQHVPVGVVVGLSLCSGSVLFIAAVFRHFVRYRRNRNVPSPVLSSVNTQSTQSEHPTVVSTSTMVCRCAPSIIHQFTLHVGWTAARSGGNLCLQEC